MEGANEPFNPTDGHVTRKGAHSDAIDGEKSNTITIKIVFILTSLLTVIVPSCKYTYCLKIDNPNSVPELI